MNIFVECEMSTGERFIVNTENINMLNHAPGALNSNLDILFNNGSKEIIIDPDAGEMYELLKRHLIIGKVME